MENIRVSVAMATYNGEKYIKEQIDSILLNLGASDELIVSDDGSTDKTLEIINQYNDNRIKIVKGPRKGVKKNFENAIKNTNGKYIFLADQDDIWHEKKVETVINEFESNKNTTLILHNANVFDDTTQEILYESFFSYRKSKIGIFHNWLKNSYIGCCMAFRKELKDIILPIPDNIEMHDQWIGIINEMYGKSILMNEVLLSYRRHRNNVSKMNHYPIYKMAINRLKLLKEILDRRRRKK